MLGIVGPRDSVTLAQQVALELGRSADLIGLAYGNVAEAVDLARTLEQLCDVVLFTGVVPYLEARRAGAWRCDIDVVRHSAADLYRMIGLILKETGGQFPRVSIDSFDAATVRQVFADMGLEHPGTIIPVVDEDGALVFEDAEATARTHLAALERGDADVALTCLAGAHRLLADAGVDTWRIDHARVTLVEALQKAWLASEVRKTKGNSIAVVLVGVSGAAGLARAKREEFRAAVDRSVMAHARRMASRVTMDDDRYMLTTTQAAVDEMLDRHRSGQKSLLDLATKPPKSGQVVVGVGFGGTYATALDSAEKAFQVSTSSHQPMIVREAGSVASILDEAGVTVSLQETSDEVLEFAERTGLGPLTLRRLISALSRVDHTAVTAQQLADFYGVMPRSARRMLSLLVAAGYGREVGVRAAAAGAGRPHVVYDVDLAGLRRMMATGVRSGGVAGA